MGIFEKEAFSYGTKEITEIISNCLHIHVLVVGIL